VALGVTELWGRVSQTRDLGPAQLNFLNGFKHKTGVHSFKQPVK